MDPNSNNFHFGESLDSDGTSCSTRTWVRWWWQPKGLGGENWSLQIYDWGKEYEQDKPLPRPLLIEQENYSCQLEDQHQVDLNCELESPHDHLPVWALLLLLLTRLLISILPIDCSSRIRSSDCAENKNQKSKIKIKTLLQEDHAYVL